MTGLGASPDAAGDSLNLGPRSDGPVRDGRRPLALEHGGQFVRDDAALGMLYFTEHYHGDEPVNLAGGHCISIKKLGELIAGIVGYQGELCWDLSKPDGMPHKALDNSHCFAYQWRPQTDFQQGLALTYQDYLTHAG